MNCLPSFGQHPCPVYFHLPYICENSIRLAKQASLAIKSSFNSVLLRVVYNTNCPLNEIVKDATPTHDLSNVVYVYKCHCRNDYIGQTSQISTSGESSTYHLSFLESLFIRTWKPKICKQRDFYNLKFYK